MIMSIVFFILGGALSISTALAFDQYHENVRLKKLLEKEDQDNEQDLCSNTNK